MSAATQPLQQHSLAEALSAAARVIARVLDGSSLDASLGLEPLAGRLRAAVQDLAYRTLRAYGRVDALAERLVERPVADKPVYALLLACLCELDERSAAEHTLVHQGVEAASLLGAARARGLVNAVLRAYQRRAKELDAELASLPRALHRHPLWWIERLRSAYPGQWSDILAEGNRHPPMGLRVNRRRTTPDAYLERLGQAGLSGSRLDESAIVLERPCPIERLPGFFEGDVSVQDAGAQHAARLLDVRDGMTVLDACAAPGGKAGHLLELTDCRLTAMDVSAARARLIEENLRRLGLQAEVCVGDAGQSGRVLRERRFDRILLDAPCTASGVVRRHPDIKWLRREADIETFACLQERLLGALWRSLEPDGKLLYATCSMFPEENGDLVSRFLMSHPDARRLPLMPSCGLENGQLLPGASRDGFYYALIGKAPCG